MGKKKLVFGVGVNDASYAVNPRVNGKIVPCPFYTAWTSMLRRAYSLLMQKRQPTYIGVAVCKEWLIFSNFKTWMETQDWEGNELDKDLLVPGNKIYSPETCVFIPQALNLFSTERRASRGNFPIGVAAHREGKFRADCGDGAGKRTYLGLFDCPQEAHKAWLTEKQRQAKILADEQNDPRIAAALIKRYEIYEGDY